MKKQDINIERIKPLDDLPVNVDDFKGKSHEKVAEALVKIISKNEGGYAIGLEGSWGSGKSTVISIAAKKLEGKDDEDLLFFPFDTWARQGDPIRRSFLELLIEFLISKSIIKRKNWEKALLEIQSKAREETKITKPNFTRFGYLMAFYGLLFPFLIFLTREINTIYGFEIAIAYSLCASIVLPILLIFLEKGIKWWRNEDDSESLLPSIRMNHHKISTEQFIKEKDATTIEFNKYFDDLIEGIVKSKKKIIIVIDNLDRLSPENIKSVWGTMRNFFTSEHWSKRYELLKNVYLIVPYDRLYISQIFSEGDDRIRINDADKKKDDNDERLNERSVSGFIDKTFKYSFQVSPPVLTHWKSFFNSQLDLAFDEQLNNEQKHDLYKLFEFQYQKNNQTITPRKIKKFINGLVVQAIEWKNKIPIRFMGLYVLQKNSLSINYRKLIESELLDERTRNYLAGEEWFKYLAALHYKVELVDALQVGFGDPIKAALVEGNTTELKEIKNNEWFEEVLEVVIEDNCKEWASSEPMTYSVVSGTLSEIRIENKVIAQKIWDNLAIKTEHLSVIKNPTKELANGFVPIIKNSSDRFKYQVVSNLFDKLKPEVNDVLGVEKFSKNYAAYISNIYSYLEKNFNKEVAENSLKSIDLGDEPNFLIHFANILNTENNLSLKYFQVNVSSKSLNEEIKSSIKSENTYHGLGETIKSLIESDLELDLNGFVQEIENRVNQNKPACSERIFGMFLSILFELRHINNQNAGTVLSEFASKGILLAYLNKSTEDRLTTALIILELIEYYELIDDIKANQSVPVYGNNTAGYNRLIEICQKPNEHEEVVSSISTLACYYKSFQSITNAVSSNKNKYELVDQLALKMIENECINGIAVDGIISNEDFIELLNEYNKLDTYFKLLDSVKISFNKLKDITKISKSILKISNELESETGIALTDKLQTELSSFDTEDWKPFLEGEKYQIELLITLLNLKQESFLSEDFGVALLDHSQKVLNEELNVKKLQDSWHLLPTALSENTRTTFYERLYDKLVEDYRENGVFRLLKLFPTDFLVSVKIESKSDQFIKNVVSGLVNSDDLDKLSWVEQNIKSVSKCFNKADKETQGYLQEILISKSGEDSKIKEKIENIAKYLKIDLDWNETDEE